MSLRFTKMQGLGNDFVVIDAVRQSPTLDAERIRHLADRRYGVGCDQVLVAETTAHPEADFRYRIWNPDGSEVEHCGNGVRCMARFLIDQGLVAERSLVLETSDGRLTRVTPADADSMRVDMGEPVLEPAAIPFRTEAEGPLYPLTVAGATLSISAVSMGNPHAVLRVEDIDTAPVATLGPALEKHPAFPNRVNAGFMQVVARDHIRLRVHERAAGETLACGTGACAAVVAGVLNHWLDATVDVTLPGGRLVIHWAGAGHPVLMTGPAVTVFEGRLPTGQA